MKAFSLNLSSKKLLSKKEQEKQKQAEEEAAAALAYDDYVKAFDQPVTSSKMFVKGDSSGGAGGTCPYSPVCHSFWLNLKLMLLDKHIVLS